jgi:DNA-binding NtrC family response regulator
MKDSRTNHNDQQTVLVIHNDAAVLTLVRGILADDYRVLLASDAGSALRLAMLEDVPIDLALIGRDTPGVRNSKELRRQLTAIRPDLGILSMVGFVDAQVIRIRMLRVPKTHMADDFLVLVSRTLSVRSLRRTVTLNRIPTDLPREERAKADRPSLTARAGSTMQ